MDVRHEARSLRKAAKSSVLWPTVPESAQHGADSARSSGQVQDGMDGQRHPPTTADDNLSVASQLHRSAPFASFQLEIGPMKTKNKVQPTQLLPTIPRVDPEAHPAKETQQADVHRE